MSLWKILHLQSKKNRDGVCRPDRFRRLLLENYGRRFRTGRSSSLLSGSVLSPSLLVVVVLSSELVLESLESFEESFEFPESLPSSRVEIFPRRRLGLFASTSAGRLLSTSAR